MTGPGQHPRQRGRFAMQTGGMALLLAGVLTLAGPAQAADAAPAEATWAVAGDQGLVRFVIVPLAQSRDRAAYAQQVLRLCEPDRTCFLNFYTNTSGAPVGLPLPDRIDQEATAVFRRSAKQGAERFQWSCRLQVAGEPCF